MLCNTLVLFFDEVQHDSYFNLFMSVGEKNPVVTVQIIVQIFCGLFISDHGRQC